MTEATRTILGNAAVIPLDGRRQILDPGHVVVEAGRIATVAAGAWPEGELAAARRIDLDGAALIPGLIDLHLHAGHGLTKNLGGDVDAWMDTVGDVYARHADAEFWAADAALQALERTLGGTTLAVPFFGGGDNVMRTEDTACAEAHLREIEASGLREILVLGVDRPPFPKPRRAWTEGRAVERSMSLSDQIAAIGTLAGRWRGAGKGLIDIAVSAPVIGEAEFAAADGPLQAALRETTTAAWALAQGSGSRFIQDGHRDGSVAFMAETFGLFDRRSVLAHCIDLTEADIATFVERGAGAAYTPSSLMAVFGYCPAPRLLAEGCASGWARTGRRRTVRSTCSGRCSWAIGTRRSAGRTRPRSTPGRSSRWRPSAARRRSASTMSWARSSPASSPISWRSRASARICSRATCPCTGSSSSPTPRTSRWSWSQGACWRKTDARRPSKPARFWTGPSAPTA